MNTSNNHSAYIPIDCSYYDKIEETIIFKKTVELVYLDSSGLEQKMNTRLTDTRRERNIVRA